MCVCCVVQLSGKPRIVLTVVNGTIVATHSRPYVGAWTRSDEWRPTATENTVSSQTNSHYINIRYYCEQQWEFRHCRAVGVTKPLDYCRNQNIINYIIIPRDFQVMPIVTTRVFEVRLSVWEYVSGLLVFSDPRAS